MGEFSAHILSFTSLVVLAQVSGEDIFHYKIVGNSLTLECANVLKTYPGCSSTTWLYNSDLRGTIKLFDKGKKYSQTGSKTSRLTLLPDCFLNISVINVEDAGRYTCRQIASDGQSTDDRLDLFVLSGTFQNDTFMCSVAGFAGLCSGVTLSWSSQGRRNTSQPENAGQCVTTLPRSETVDGEALQCLLKKDGSLENSFSFPARTKVMGPGGTAEHDQPLFNLPFLPVYLAVTLGGVLLLIVVVLLVVRKKRTGVKQSATKCVVEINAIESIGKEEPAMCQDIGPGEPEEVMTYASINHLTPSSKAWRRRDDVGGSNGDVTYSAISKPSS